MSMMRRQLRTDSEVKELVKVLVVTRCLLASTLTTIVVWLWEQLKCQMLRQYYSHILRLVCITLLEQSAGTYGCLARSLRFSRQQKWEHDLLEEVSRRFCTFTRNSDKRAGYLVRVPRRRIEHSMLSVPVCLIESLDWQWGTGRTLLMNNSCSCVSAKIWKDTRRLASNATDFSETIVSLTCFSSPHVTRDTWIWSRSA